MPLKEQDRAKLDKIVQQMEANGESDNYIRSVVNDFKSKYGGDDITGLAPGQKLPGMHKPEVDMHEQITPANAFTNLAAGAGKGLVSSINPVNAVTGLYSAAKNTIADPTGMNRAAQDEAEDETILKKGPQSADNPAFARGAGEAAGNIGGQILANAVGNRIASAKAPIGTRMAEAEQDLDNRGIFPSEQDLVNNLDTARSKNLTSGGIPLNEPLDNRLGRVYKQVDKMYNMGPLKQAPAFSDISSLKKTLQKEASSGGYFDNPETKASTAGAGQASTAVRNALRNTPGAEEWSAIQDEASRAHKINNAVGKVGGAVGAIAAPAFGVTHGHSVMGALGLPAAAKAGQMAGEAASDWVTSGRAANQLKPISPVVRMLPLVNALTRNDDNQ